MRRIRRYSTEWPGKENDFPAEARKMERSLKQKDAERLDLVLQRGFAKAVSDRTELMIFKVGLVAEKSKLQDFLSNRLHDVRLHELELFHPKLYNAMMDAQRKGLVVISGAGRYPVSQCIDFYH